MEAPYIILLAVLGLCVGSFLNVVIARVPVGESVITPGSHCPRCQTELAPWDNVPVLSWLLLRGRCRTCHQSISIQYPLVELANAGLWALAAYQFTHLSVVVAVAVFLSGLLALSVIDLQLFRLPTRVVYPTLLAGLVLTTVASYRLGGSVGNAWALEKYALGGMVFYSGLLFVLHIVSPRGIGFGDVRLALVLGLYLGWLSPREFDGVSNLLSVAGMVFWALALGCIIGLVTGVAWRLLVPVVDPEDVDPQGDGHEDEGTGDEDSGADSPAAGADRAPAEVRPSRTRPTAGVVDADVDVDGEALDAEEAEVAVPARPFRKMAVPFGPGLALGTALLVLFPGLRP